MSTNPRSRSSGAEKNRHLVLLKPDKNKDPSNPPSQESQGFAEVGRSVTSAGESLKEKETEETHLTKEAKALVPK